MKALVDIGVHGRNHFFDIRTAFFQLLDNLGVAHQAVRFHGAYKAAGIVDGRAMGRQLDFVVALQQ